MKIDYFKMTRDFIVNEGQGPSINSYIQSLAEVLESISPKTISDARRLEVAKENLQNLRRHTRRLEEKIKFLEEEITVIRENEKYNEDKI
mgnify:CR=1 FL=1